MKFIKYGAPWCAPCKAMDRYAERIVTEAGVGYEHVDIDAEPDRMPEGASSVPVLALYDDQGVEVKRHVGVLAPKALESWLSSSS